MRKVIIGAVVLAVAVSFGFGTAVVARATMEHQGGTYFAMHGDDICPTGGNSTSESGTICPHGDEHHDSMMAEHESHHSSMMGGHESHHSNSNLPENSSP